MARVTVEDCVDKVENRFELVLLSSHRARQISAGQEITVPRDNDKHPVVALREIAEETLSPEDLKEDLIHSLQNHVEVDELEPEDLPATASNAALDVDYDNGDSATSEGGAFGSISEDELLRGIEGLVAPERSDDY